MKTTADQLAHRREIHAEAIAKADIDVGPGNCVQVAFTSDHAIGAKRRGRPPLPLDQRTRKRNYSIRLNPEHIAELQRRGTKALEEWLDSVHNPTMQQDSKPGYDCAPRVDVAQESAGG